MFRYERIYLPSVDAPVITFPAMCALPAAFSPTNNNVCAVFIGTKKKTTRKCTHGWTRARAPGKERESLREGRSWT